VIVELSRIQDEPLTFREELELAEERLGAEQVTRPFQVLLEGVVRRSVSGYHIEGRIEGAGGVSCARCLEEVTWSSDETFAIELRPSAKAPEEEEVGLTEGDLVVSFLDSDSIDLAEVAAEQVLLALPMRVLCKPSCAGLCPRCGGNLNVEGDCRCEPEVDPRWETLRKAWDRSS